MDFTIFGYPKSGKTTLFNLLTGAKIEISPNEKSRKEPNRRIHPIPDARLDQLWELYPDKNKHYATIEYTDLAGISYGEIRNEAYLSHIRNAEGLTHVARGFMNPEVPHHKEGISPREDITSMEEELILTDLVSIENRLEKLEKELKKSHSLEGEQEKEILVRIQSRLEKGSPLREFVFSPAEEKQIRSFSFLSQKPLLHMINVDEKDIPLIESPEKFYPEQKKGTAVLAFCGKVESEIMELNDKEKDIFLKEYGIKQLSAPKFLRASYDLLEVITFFTIGKEEIRAWTIKKDTNAVTAAGAIHTDMQKGFIRAEVIPQKELLGFGSLQSAKDKGAVQLEGKEYIIKDGDVIYIRFSS